MTLESWRETVVYEYAPGGDEWGTVVGRRFNAGDWFVGYRYDDPTRLVVQGKWKGDPEKLWPILEQSARERWIMNGETLCRIGAAMLALEREAEENGPCRPTY